VLLADDYDNMHAAVGRLLSSTCKVLEGVRDCHALFDAAVRLRPDVILLDLSLPGMSAVDACRLLRSIAPDVDVVAFTATDDDQMRQRVREAGAADYVLKIEAGSALWPAVRDVVARRASSRNDARA
jgi:DNA-binding NarL/FixJ family response regulator